MQRTVPVAGQRVPRAQRRPARRPRVVGVREGAQVPEVRLQPHVVVGEPLAAVAEAGRVGERKVVQLAHRAEVPEEREVVAVRLLQRALQRPRVA